MDQQDDFNPFGSETPGPAAEGAALGEILVRPTPETYDELQRAYDFFNERLFRGELPPCLITLQRERRTFGYFQSTTFVRRTGETSDEITLNPRYFATRSIRETLSTLVREMVSLWQHHHGATESRRGYHNKEWADQMEQVGLMPSSTGQPGGRRVGEKLSHYIVAGGPFDTACTKLVTEEFSLSWMDRHPMAVPRRPTVNSPAEEAAATPAMVLPSPADVAQVEAAERHVVLPTERDVSRRRTDNSNRVKYRCPSCATQVWGKPNLVILCGAVQCDRATFEAARAIEPG